MGNPECYNDDQIKQEFMKRLFTNFLDLIVIAHFQQEPFSGYDVVQFAHMQLSFKISPGTIYATLYAMERKGLLESSDQSGKRMFKATEKGLYMVKLAMSPGELTNFFEHVMKK